MVFRIVHHRSAYHERFKKIFGSDDLTLPTGQKSIKTYTNVTCKNLKTGEVLPVVYVAYEFDEPEDFVRECIEGWKCFGRCYMMDDVPILAPAYI